MPWQTREERNRTEQEIFLDDLRKKDEIKRKRKEYRNSKMKKYLSQSRIAKSQRATEKRIKEEQSQGPFTRLLRELERNS